MDDGHRRVAGKRFTDDDPTPPPPPRPPLPRPTGIAWWGHSPALDIVWPRNCRGNEACGKCCKCQPLALSQDLKRRKAPPYKTLAPSEIRTGNKGNVMHNVTQQAVDTRPPHTYDARSRGQSSQPPPPELPNQGTQRSSLRPATSQGHTVFGRPTHTTSAPLYGLSQKQRITGLRRASGVDPRMARLHPLPASPNTLGPLTSASAITNGLSKASGVDPRLPRSRPHPHPTSPITVGPLASSSALANSVMQRPESMAVATNTASKRPLGVDDTGRRQRPKPNTIVQAATPSVGPSTAGIRRPEPQLTSMHYEPLFRPDTPPPVVPIKMDATADAAALHLPPAAKTVTSSKTGRDEDEEAASDDLGPPIRIAPGVYMRRPRVVQQRGQAPSAKDLHQHSTLLPKPLALCKIPGLLDDPFPHQPTIQESDSEEEMEAVTPPPPSFATRHITTGPLGIHYKPDGPVTSITITVEDDVVVVDGSGLLAARTRRKYHSF